MDINKQEFLTKFEKLPLDYQKKMDDMLNKLLIELHLEETEEDLNEEDIKELRMLEKDINSVETTRHEDINWDE